jgi:diguanylate cyclase (GGDEF)-like protein
MHGPRGGARGADLLARLFARSERVPLLLFGAGCVLATTLIALVDAAVAPGLALSVFYLLPVLLAASRGFLLGILLAVVTATTWCTVELIDHSGGYGSVAVPVANALSRLVVLSIVVVLVTGLRGARQREAELARRDALTGLANARSFYDAVDDARRVQARTGRPLTLAYLDLDDFKAVNDELGHAAGDDLLRRVAEVLTASVREVDTVARLGGDEFVVLLPETSHDASEVLLARLHEALTELRFPATVGDGGLPRPLTVSMGAVTFPRFVSTAHAMVSEADRVMYEVKRDGKNRFSSVLSQDPGPAGADRW